MTLTVQTHTLHACYNTCIVAVPQGSSAIYEEPDAVLAMMSNKNPRKLDSFSYMYDHINLCSCFSNYAEYYCLKSCQKEP